MMSVCKHTKQLDHKQLIPNKFIGTGLFSSHTLVKSVFEMVSLEKISRENLPNSFFFVILEQRFRNSVKSISKQVPRNTI